MEHILVDQEGYNQFFEELNKLKKSLASNAADGSNACQSAVGDGWHDNFDYEDTMRKERDVTFQINTMLKKKPYLKIVEKVNKKNVINLGDILKINIKYSDNGFETKTIKLTGKYLPDLESKIAEVTLNSPLGKAIYLKNINKPITYLVNNYDIEINVIEKLN